MAAGGILGTALFKGFDRLSAIDQAQAKLRGLGNTTKTVTKIMDNALASVKGTAFGLGDAATVAAQVVAAGVKPGKDLQRTLKLTADAATIAGVSLSDMGAIFGKVAASNKIQGDVINQLNDAGVPIIQLLGKEMGKTSAQVTQLASKGKIDFATFQNAMESGLGGAALKSGNTFKGALANMNAALGRLGAGLLTGLFPIAKQVFGGVTVLLDNLTAKVGPAASAFSAKLPGAFAAIAAALGNIDFGAVASKFSPLISAFKDFATNVIAAGAKIGPALLKIAKGLAPFAKLAGVVAVVALTVAFRALGPVVLGLATAFAGITNFVASNQTTFTILAGIIGAVLLPVLIQSTVAFVANAASVLATNAAWLIYGITVKAIAIGTKIFTAAQWLLNAALTANPIGLVIVALVALGAALVLLWTKSSTFRAIVTGAFNAVKNAAITAFNWVKAHWPLLLAIITGPIGLAVLAVIKNWDRIRSAAATALHAVTSLFKSLPGRIVSGLGNLGGLLVSAGKDIVHGLISGIGSLKGAVTAALLALIPGPLKKFAGKLGIHSPSTVFHDFGVNIGQGLVNGINAKAKDITASIAEVARDIAATFKKHDISKSMADQMTKVVAATQKGIDKVKALIDTMKSFASDVSGNFLNDIFNKGSDTTDGLQALRDQLATDTSAANVMAAALKKATSKGLSGGLLKHLAASGDSTTAQQIADLSKAQIAQLEKDFNARNKAALSVGSLAGGEVFGKEISDQQARIARTLDKLDQKLYDATFKGTRDGLKSGAASGQNRASNSVRGR